MTVKRAAGPRGDEVQFIKERGARKFAVLPIEVYETLLEELDMLADVRAYDEAKARKEEIVPFELSKRLIAGENPIRVWREHRGLSVADLAKEAGLSASHLSRLEGEIGRGGAKALRSLAVALDIDLDDIAP